MTDELERETSLVVSALKEMGATTEPQGVVTIVWLPGISTRASISLEPMHDELRVREQSQSPDDEIESWWAKLDKQDRSKWIVGKESKLRTSRELAAFIWERALSRSATS